MQFDVVIIGGGHAGCEAAAAAARMGVRTALVTLDPAKIGAMSCNPAIGGVGKGHLVREVDVFDGLIGRAADHAAIHYRMLNASKGAAVHGPRVQADRRRFQAEIQRLLVSLPYLTIIAAEAEALDIDHGRLSGVTLSGGTRLGARAAIIASGTFLGAKLHLGLSQQTGGRVGEGAAVALAESLRALGLPLGRMKTGTPPRLDGRTIDWSRLATQPSDAGRWTMSSLGPGRVAPQLACAITRTNVATHDIIRGALGRSPLYAGVIEGQGPRYCPSIEDKVVRFGDRDGHQIFLEPEGLDSALVYPNGISTSLPLSDQAALLASIEGLERAQIVQAGYAVEYDHVDPRLLDHSLQMRALPGLFCAGQINGTTGYEEAAAQGLVAGLAAAAISQDRMPIRFDRRDSYIGVMIDDLVLQGVTEPYRMLTSRAEHRLHLRADNAVARLGASALASGAISGERRVAIEHHLARRSVAARQVEAGLLESDHTHWPDAWADVREELAADRLYAPYLARQMAEIERLARDESVSLARLDTFAGIGGLSTEMVERLERARPASLAEARRVRGITPAAVSAILVAARRA